MKRTPLAQLRRYDLYAIWEPELRYQQIALRTAGRWAIFSSTAPGGFNGGHAATAGFLLRSGGGAPAVWGDVFDAIVAQ